jgi:hypothetical protein
MNLQPLEFPLPDGSTLEPLRTGHVRIDRPSALKGRTPAAAILAAAACQRGWAVACGSAPHPGVGPFFETIEPGPHAGLVAYVHAELQRRRRREAAGDEPLLLVLDDTVATVPGWQAAAPVLRQLIDIVRYGRAFRIIVALEVVDAHPQQPAPPHLPAEIYGQFTTRLAVDGVPRSDNDRRWRPSRLVAPIPPEQLEQQVLAAFRRWQPSRPVVVSGGKRPALAALRGIGERWRRRCRQEGSVR